MDYWMNKWMDAWVFGQTETTLDSFVTILFPCLPWLLLFIQFCFDALDSSASDKEGHSIQHFSKQLGVPALLWH